MKGTLPALMFEAPSPKVGAVKYTLGTNQSSAVKDSSVVPNVLPLSTQRFDSLFGLARDAFIQQSNCVIARSNIFNIWILCLLHLLYIVARHFEWRSKEHVHVCFCYTNTIIVNKVSVNSTIPHPVYFHY